MFGYIRPNKGELKIKEFTRFRAFYCGLCKAISAEFGQVPRLATTYDFSFLSLFLQALAPEDAQFAEENCILQPLTKKAIAKDSTILSYSAAGSILLAYYKLEDNILDQEQVLLAKSAQTLLKRAYKKAQGLYPDLNKSLKVALGKQLELEQAKESFPALLAEKGELAFLDELCQASGFLVEAILQHAPLPELSEQIKAGLKYFANYLGRWIYLVDALHDYEADLAKAAFNPLSFLDQQEPEVPRQLLNYYEEQLELSTALLPYYRDASIIENVILLGLPAVSQAVLAGEDLPSI